MTFNPFYFLKLEVNFKKFKFRAAEMAQRMRPLVAEELELSLEPCTPVKKLSMLCNPSFVGGRYKRSTLLTRLKGIMQRETEFPSGLSMQV